MDRHHQPRMLVLGFGGQLATQFAKTCTDKGVHVDALTHEECDITSPSMVAAAIAKHQPTTVVNCAAYTAVDAAEENTEKAFAINAYGPQLLAAECMANDIDLLHVSTDFVFPGTGSTPLGEWDAVAPVNVYGRSKWAGEEAIRHTCPRHIIVRTSWLFGMAGPNFIRTILTKAKETNKLSVVSDQFGSPSYTADVAPAMLALALDRAYGSWNVTNSGSASWHDVAARAVAAAGLDTKVAAITTAHYPTKAKRPAYTVLSSEQWNASGRDPLPNWSEAVDRYVAEIAALV